MNPDAITPAEATKRVLATALQAGAAALLVILGFFVTGGLTAAVAATTVVSSFAVPVLTAIQRYSQAWLANKEG